MNSSAARARSFFEPEENTSNLTPPWLEEKTIELPKITSLHLHSDASLLDGMSRHSEIATFAAANSGAASCTEHGTCSGFVSFATAAQKKGIKAIFGFEAYIVKGSRFEKSPRETGEKSLFHLTLLAKDWTGYQNLLALSSAGFEKEAYYYKPRIDLALLEQHSEGVILLSGCLGSMSSQLLLAGKVDECEELFNFYLRVFRERFFIEIQNHGIPEQKKINPILRQLAKKLGVGMVATNDSHYTSKGDAVAHEAMLAINTRDVLSNPERFCFPNEEFYLKTSDELSLFLPVSEWGTEIYTNTNLIAEMCDVQLPIGNKRKYLLPKIPGMEKTKLDSEEKLRFDAYEGLLMRFPELFTELDSYLKKVFSASAKIPEEKKIELKKRIRPFSGLERLSVLVTYLQKHDFPLPDFHSNVTRLEYELGIVNQMGFADYLLIVADYINWAKDNGILVGPARGSSGGSLVCYCTRITDINPISYGLIFERFLNPDRISMPDIDTDFDDAGRARVIQYVQETYGHDKVAYIATTGTLGSRSVLKDVARVMQIDYSLIDEITKMIPVKFGKSFSLTKSEEIPEIRNLLTTQLWEVWNCAKKLEGLSRHSSVHASGVVIAPMPLTDLVPVSVDKNSGMFVTQYDMKGVEDIGLVKMDFLGLRTLSLLDAALKLIREKEKDFALPDKDFTDAKTFELLRTGNLKGVFQLEGGGISAATKNLRPDRFEDIIAISALYRPGPMENIPSYIARKHGHESVEFNQYPSTEKVLEPILRETYGIIVYQEQVIQIAAELCGFTNAQADNFRRAIGKKDKELLMEQKDRFISGGIQTHEIPEEEMEALFAVLVNFADYSFNKSHSAAYGILSFQTAYLKANFPGEFMAALLSIEYGDSDKLSEYLADLKSMNLAIQGPSINVSDAESFTAHSEVIYFAFAAIKGLGADAAQKIVAERRKKRYVSLIDFIERNKLNSKALGNLIKAGSFDDFGERNQLLSFLEDAQKYVEKSGKTKQAGMINLFDTEDFLPEPQVPSVSAWTESEKISAEKESLGMYVSGHPLAQNQILLKTSEMTAKEFSLVNLAEKKKIIWTGIFESIAIVVTKKGETMARLTSSDASGTSEMIVFPQSYTRLKNQLVLDIPVCCIVSLSEDQGSRRISLDNIVPFDDFNLDILIANANTPTISSLEKFIAENPGREKIIHIHDGKEENLGSISFESGKKLRNLFAGDFHLRVSRQEVWEWQAKEIRKQFVPQSHKTYNK